MRIDMLKATTPLVMALLIGCAGDADVASDMELAESTRVTANEQVILDFFAAWSRLDPTEIAGYFTDDGIYHNMPVQPVQGRENVEALIRGFSASWTETTWEVLTLMSSGDTVIAERIDRTRAGEKSVDLPVVGVFVLEGGKIKEWRDYYDQQTYVRGMM